MTQTTTIDPREVLLNGLLALQGAVEALIEKDDVTIRCEANLAECEASWIRPVLPELEAAEDAIASAYKSYLEGLRLYRENVNRNLEDAEEFDREGEREALSLKS